MNEDKDVTKKKKFSTYVSMAIGGFVVISGIIWFIIMMSKKEYRYAIPAVLFIMIGVVLIGLTVYSNNRRGK